MDYIKKHIKPIIFGALMLVLICGISYFIYHNYSKNIITCSIKKRYDNYQTSIVVTFNKDNILSFEEVFESADKSILKTKRIEATLLDYSHSVLKNKIIVKHDEKYSKDKKDIIKQYIDSGYTCTNEEKKKTKVIFVLSDYSSYQEIGKDYEEVEYKASINGEDSFENVLIDNNNFDPMAIGKYVVTYKLNISDVRDDYLYRVVSVEDRTPPVIKLKGNQEITLKKGETFTDPGAEVTDNYDKDIKNKLKVTGEVKTNEFGEYKIIYEAIDSSNNKTVVERVVKVTTKGGIVPVKKEKDGITYFDNTIIVNKKYSVPKEYSPGLNDDAYNAFTKLQRDAKKKKFKIEIISGFRNYKRQEELYNKYVREYGADKASTFSAKPGQSEHQTGLALDVGVLDTNYGDTAEGKWLASNAYKYGFIIRYPKGKERITGYEYEPWHIRYLGNDLAAKVYKSGLTLEEYFGIDE